MSGGQRETGAARRTELRLGRIHLLAPGTHHAVALQSLSRRTFKPRPKGSGAGGAGQGGKTVLVGDSEGETLRRMCGHMHLHKVR